MVTFCWTLLFRSVRLCHKPELAAFARDAHAVFEFDALVPVPDHAPVQYVDEIVHRDPEKSRPWKNSCLRQTKKPSAVALSGLHLFALIDPARPYSAQMRIHPAQRWWHPTDMAPAS